MPIGGGYHHTPPQISAFVPSRGDMCEIPAATSQLPMFWEFNRIKKGSTENAGLENEGPKKSGVENAGTV